MSYYNVQLPKFNSKFVSPGSWGAHAFAQDWSCEINWICPPVSLMIAHAVRELDSCNRCGILFIPEWPLASLWSFLHSTYSLFKSFDKDDFVLPRIDILLLKVQDRWKFTSPRTPYSVHAFRSGCRPCDFSLCSLFIPQWGMYLECLFHLGVFDLCHQYGVCGHMGCRNNCYFGCLAT